MNWMIASFAAVSSPVIPLAVFEHTFGHPNLAKYSLDSGFGGGLCVMDRQGNKLVHCNVRDNDFDYFLKLVVKN